MNSRSRGLKYTLSRGPAVLSSRNASREGTKCEDRADCQRRSTRTMGRMEERERSQVRLDSSPHVEPHNNLRHNASARCRLRGVRWFRIYIRHQSRTSLLVCSWLQYIVRDILATGSLARLVARTKCRDHIQSNALLSQAQVEKSRLEKTRS